MPIPVRTADGRIVAQIEGRNLVKKVVESKHKLRKPESWAFDICIIEEAIEKKVENIVVKASDTKATYSIPLADFLANKIEVSRGFNKQWAVTVNNWFVDGVNRPPPRLSKVADNQEAKQLRFL